MNRYRLVWLVCDPFTGGRVVLGALVSADGAVSFASANRAFRKSLSPAQQVLADIVCEELASAQAFDELPAGLGPQVIAGAPVRLPERITEPGRWVRESVLRLAA